jgi:hypothetical protein
MELFTFFSLEFVSNVIIEIFIFIAVTLITA